VTTEPDNRSRQHVSGHFVTTQWSLILCAGNTASTDASEALEHLCRTYWYPLYAYVRRKGHAPADAQDLTQDFFARFLGREYLKLVDRNRGRFRTFLLSSLNHFLVNEWRKTRTVKRGGTHQIVSLDERTAEGRYLAEPIDELSPDRIYEKRWAVALLEAVMMRLRDDYACTGKQPLFDTLKFHVWGDAKMESYNALSGQLGMSEGAVRVAVHRLRERFRDLLRDEVGRTVESPAEIDEELRELVATLRG
jgi:RNA polymerase sigma factor (sigma-70 family)